MITALKAAGLPSVIGIVQGLELLKGKKQSDMRKWGQRFFETEFPGHSKAIDACNSGLLARTLSTTPARRVHWRSIRSYIVADSAEVVPLDGPKGAEHGALHIRGYIRGRPLGVNQVVQLGDIGHFRMKQINSSSEPFPIKPKYHSCKEPAGQPATGSQRWGNGEVLAVADPDQQEDLNVEAEIDGLAGEQTWPTEQEMAQAGLDSKEGMDGMGEQEADEGAEPQPRGSKELPQGWSGYQAEWLAGASSAEGGDTDHSDDGEAWALDEEKEEDEDGLGDLTDASLDAAKRRQAANEDGRFPDEVDTPADRSARERFARFRALKSFRTSPWDPKESLPQDYARIFQVNAVDVLSACRPMRRSPSPHMDKQMHIPSFK